MSHRTEAILSGTSPGLREILMACLMVPGPVAGGTGRGIEQVPVEEAVADPVAPVATIALEGAPPFSAGSHQAYRFRLIEPGHTFVYCLDTRSRVTRHFPREATAARHEAGAEFRISGRIEGPGGEELLVILVSREPCKAPDALVRQHLETTGSLAGTPSGVPDGDGFRDRVASLRRAWIASGTGSTGRGLEATTYRVLDAGVVDPGVPSPPVRSRRVALLIGISRYPALPDRHQLAFSASDARRMDEVLDATRGSRPYVRRCLLDGAATAGAIREALDRWLPGEVRRDDQVFFYFSGHGTQVPESLTTGDGVGDEADGLDEALCPSDVTTLEPPDPAGPRPRQRPGAPRPAVILDDEIHRALGTIARKRPSQIWLILDACFSGGAAKSPRPTPPGARSRFLAPETLFPRRAGIAASPARSPAGGAPIGPTGSGLQTLDGTKSHVDSALELPDIENLVFMAACQPWELARESTAVGPGGGIFTHHLIEVLRESRAGPDCSTVGSIMDRVRSRVRQGGWSQTPVLAPAIRTGKLCFEEPDP